MNATGESPTSDLFVRRAAVPGGSADGWIPTGVIEAPVYPMSAMVSDPGGLRGCLSHVSIAVSRWVIPIEPGVERSFIRGKPDVNRPAPGGKIVRVNTAVRHA